MPSKRSASDEPQSAVKKICLPLQQESKILSNMGSKLYSLSYGKEQGKASAALVRITVRGLVAKVKLVSQEIDEILVTMQKSINAQVKAEAELVRMDLKRQKEETKDKYHDDQLLVHILGKLVYEDTRIYGQVVEQVMGKMTEFPAGDLASFIKKEVKLAWKQQMKGRMDDDVEAYLSGV